jgi:hypothetical protein
MPSSILKVAEMVFFGALLSDGMEGAPRGWLFRDECIFVQEIPPD